MDRREFLNALAIAAASRAVAKRTDVRVNLSIGTLDEATWKATEPGTPHPRQRVEAVRKLVDAGLLVPGDRVVFTSGEHMETHGATNTLRLLQVGEDGTAEGLGEL